MKPFEPFDPAPVWVKTDEVLRRLADPATGRKLCVYGDLQDALRKVDVRTDAEYQRKYRGFYRVRRKPSWCAPYFALLERAKGEAMSFDAALTAFCERTRRVEASFVSKLVATINPTAPVWDQFVLRNLELRKPPYHDNRVRRLAECIAVYKEICVRVAALEASTEGAAWIGCFNEARPEFKHFTATKKFDVFLWLARDHSRAAARTAPKLTRSRTARENPDA